MEEKKNKYIWIIVILLIIILGLMGFICYDKFFNVSTQDNNVVDQKDNNNVVDNEKEESIVIKEVLYDTSKYVGDTPVLVELTNTGKVLASFTDKKDTFHDREVVFTDINKAALVHFGKSDVCEGNARLVFIMNDTTLSDLDIDMLVCGREIKTETNIAGLHGIVEVYEEEEENVPKYEPQGYRVFAKSTSDTVTEITDYFK